MRSIPPSGCSIYFVAVCLFPAAFFWTTAQHNTVIRRFTLGDVMTARNIAFVLKPTATQVLIERDQVDESIEARCCA